MLPPRGRRRRQDTRGILRVHHEAGSRLHHHATDLPPCRQDHGALHGKVLEDLRGDDRTEQRLVTQQEQSLRRQHLELLLFAARVAAMQPDGTAYAQSLEAASTWLTQFFDTSSAGVTAALAEIEALRGINVEPDQPKIGAAARQLQRLMVPDASTP